MQGPILCCLVYRTVYDHTLHHHDFHGQLLPNPMNTASCFSLTLALSSLLYCATFLFSLQFRGDFGIMPDNIDESTGASSWPSVSLPLSSQANDSLGQSGIADLGEIVAEDLRLLVSPPRYGYGSRLHNLKVDLKDL